MRRTPVLYGINYHRLLKRMWKKESQMHIAPLEISPELQELGIKIHDARAVVKEESNHKELEDETYDLLIPNDYSPAKKFYLFDDRVKVTEKEDQALCLTKTILYSGLPKSITSLIGLEQIPNQDELVQQCAIQAFVKDSQLVKLPKKVDVTNPGYIFKREFGARYKRKSYGLMEKLTFLSEMTCGKYPEIILRNKIIHPFCETVIERGEDTIIFQIPGDILYTSPKPLKPFSPLSEVQGTKDIAVPSLYPVKPTLDLEQREVNPARHINDIHLLDVTSAPTHIHTLHMIHKTYGFWFPHQKLAKAIVACFTYAAKEARQKYGNDVEELPEPISMQCIYSDMAKIGFIAYQLNTLNVGSDDGIKNQVWVDEAQKMCEQIHEKMMYEVTGISNYDNTIFPKIVAMYLNGAHPSSL